MTDRFEAEARELLVKLLRSSNAAESEVELWSPALKRIREAQLRVLAQALRQAEARALRDLAADLACSGLLRAELQSVVRKRAAKIERGER